MDALRSLVKKFKELYQEKDPLPTFLEISGYPHYEKVISNILLFYLDSRNPHDFGILPVKSLLSAARVDIEKIDPEELRVNDATTEEATKEGKFIDIVVETGSYVIGIENKVYAHEYNPFGKYKTHIVNRAEALGKEPVLILLTLKNNKYNSKPANSFERVTYEDFFKEFEKWELDGNNDNSEYHIFFKNFKQTLVNMGTSKFSDEEIEFLTMKYDSLIDLHQRVFVKFEKFSRSQLKIIDELLSDCKKDCSINLSALNTKKDQLEAVSFYEFENLQGTKAEHLNLKVKLRVRPHGWYTEIWDQGTPKESKLMQFLDDADIKNRQENDLYKDTGLTDPKKYSYICEKFVFKEKPDNIADALEDYLIKIATHISGNNL